jgi:hypothetical protein
MRFSLLIMILCFGAAGSADVSATGRCAYVDVSLFGMAEPKQQCFSLDMTCGPEAQHGCFPSPLAFKDGWIDGGTRGKLRELSAPFSYIDREGVHWDVPAGYQTDGATIPMFFQPVVGGPWTDGYIKAAVVHDFYIRRGTVHADAVHKMFYLALLAAGNSQRRAQDMFLAVKKFGPQWKHAEVAAYEAAWRARKGMLDQVTKWHQEVWEAFQASERKREQQAAIDRASLSRPLRERTHVFRLPESGDVMAGLDAFIEDAVADHIIHPDRDATLVKLLREQVDAELQRPADSRNNVFLLQFTTLGATIVSFPAHSEAELNVQLEDSDRFTSAQEQAVDLPPAICVGECLNRHRPSAP